MELTIIDLISIYVFTILNVILIFIFIKQIKKYSKINKKIKSNEQYINSIITGIVSGLCVIIIQHIVENVLKINVSYDLSSIQAFIISSFGWIMLFIFAGLIMVNFTFWLIINGAKLNSTN